MLAGNAVEVPADPAVSRLRPSRITIGIRPRAFIPASDGGQHAISVAAELIEPMGAETLVHARAPDGADIRVVVPRETRIKIGEALHLKLDPKQTHFFDPEGRAVRS